MILKDYYWYFQAALDDEVCDKIIERGKERMDEEIEKYGKEAIIAQVGGRSSVYNFGEDDSADIVSRKIPQQGKTKEQLKTEGINIADTFARDSYVSFFSDIWIYKVLHEYLQQANTNAGWDYQVDFSEPLQYTEYKSAGVSGKGQFYGWHCDGQFGEYKLYDEDNTIHENTAWLRDGEGNKITGLSGHPQFVDNSWTRNPDWDKKIRKISMTVNLTNPGEYSGGEFEIDRGPHFADERYYTVSEIRPRGSIIVFPAFVYHQVTPITWGERKSLVMWTMGPKWR